MVNREFIFMCEHNDLLLALPQITINEPREKMEFVPEEEAEEDQKDEK